LPLHLNHDHTQQVGVLLLHDTPTALAANGKLNLDLPLARDTYSNLLFNAKHGVKTGLSIGYRTVKDRMDGSVRHLLELALKEGSLTLFPANQQALVSAVKSEVDKHEQRLLEQRLLGLLAEARKAFEWKRRT
jgi:HK97 family phage prohead protease